MPDMKLELVPIGVSDVDRARAFYADKAGFKLEVDVNPMPGMRVIQFTPPGSACSIVFGDGMDGISNIKPGSITGIHLVVKEMDEARQALIDRGVDVGRGHGHAGREVRLLQRPRRQRLGPAAVAGQL